MFKRAAKEADPALVAAQKEVRPRDPWTTTWLQHAHCLACDSATRTLSLRIRPYLTPYTAHACCRETPSADPSPSLCPCVLGAASE